MSQRENNLVICMQCRQNAVKALRKVWFHIEDRNYDTE